MCVSLIRNFTHHFPFIKINHKLCNNIPYTYTYPTYSLENVFIFYRIKLKRIKRVFPFFGLATYADDMSITYNT